MFYIPFFFLKTYPPVFFFCFFCFFFLHFIHIITEHQVLDVPSIKDCYAAIKLLILTVKSQVTDIWKVCNLKDIDIDIQWLTYPVLCTLREFQREGLLPCPPWFREQSPSCSRSQQNHVHHQPKVKGICALKMMFLWQRTSSHFPLQKCFCREWWQDCMKFVTPVEHVRRTEKCPGSRCSSIQSYLWPASLKMFSCIVQAKTQKYTQWFRNKDTFTGNLTFNFSVIKKLQDCRWDLPSGRKSRGRE